jgi:hypothetical protein
MSRRSADKFIPPKDGDFCVMANGFARTIGDDPARFGMSADDAAEVIAAARAFDEARQADECEATSTRLTTLAKNDARQAAERIVRRIANQIRGDSHVSDSDKLSLRIEQRPATLARRKCPQTAPALLFEGSNSGKGASGELRDLHVIRFFDAIGTGTLAKPEGAERLELFVELVARDERVPAHPGELTGGRAWYLRSFTRSPMRIEFPMPAAPRLVVYWGRWAGAGGEVGPWSETLVTRVEGWTQRLPALAGSRAAVSAPQLECNGELAPPTRRSSYRVELLTARYRVAGDPAITPGAAPALPDAGESEFQRLIG